jgi:hypothetical protein
VLRLRMVELYLHSQYVLLGSGKLLLVLDSIVILCSEYREAHDHILLSHDSGSRLHTFPLSDARLIKPRDNITSTSPFSLFLHKEGLCWYIAQMGRKVKKIKYPTTRRNPFK